MSHVRPRAVFYRIWRELTVVKRKRGYGRTTVRSLHSRLYTTVPPLERCTEARVSFHTLLVLRARALAVALRRLLLYRERCFFA